MTIARRTGDALASRRASVTQISIVRRSLDNSQVRMRLRLALLRRLHEAIDSITRVAYRELGEQERKFLVVCFCELGFHTVRKLPHPLLERSDRFLAGFVEELFVGVAWLALVFRVLTQPIIDLVAQLTRHVIEQHRL